MSLKVVKFDTKMYLNFSNFRGRTSAGGDKPWSKNGDKCRMGGGLVKFLLDGGTPQSPQEKNPADWKNQMSYTAVNVALLTEG